MEGLIKMTMADEYQPQINVMIADLKFKELNDQMSKWADEGVIEDFNGQDSIPYFRFDWNIYLSEPEFETEYAHWDPNADFYDDAFEGVIDKAWDKLEIPNGGISYIWQKDLAVIVNLYEMDDRGIPSTSTPWDNYYCQRDDEIQVKWSVLKPFVTNPDELDCESGDEVTVDISCSPWLNEVDIIFTDGSELHYDQNAIEA